MSKRVVMGDTNERVVKARKKAAMRDKVHADLLKAGVSYPDVNPLPTESKALHALGKQFIEWCKKPTSFAPDAFAIEFNYSPYRFKRIKSEEFQEYYEHGLLILRRNNLDASRREFGSNLKLVDRELMLFDTEYRAIVNDEELTKSQKTTYETCDNGKIHVE